MKQLLILPLLAVTLIEYSQANTSNNMKKKETATCIDGCEKKPITCKLTSPEIQQRKITVIASLKKKIIVKKEISNGFSYKFFGSDAVVDELITFVKTERLCCDFFDFSLSVKGDGTSAWLTITGPKGAKDFIKNELEL
jgi:hypothetical protein